ncbi:MAG: hypothetical protein IJ538_01080 [Clostridia bacterium]|nr:hypothetical protein [Clostridia bacterium]
MKASKILFNICAFFGFIYGSLYLFSLVFIPVGIYCFLGAKLFALKADHISEPFSVDKKLLKNYVIFLSIFCFPFGLLSILAYNLAFGHNAKIETVVEPQSQEKATESEVVEAKVEEPETMEEKQEKFEKLKKFNEKGLVTDEELEMARKQLFGNDK